SAQAEAPASLTAPAASATSDASTYATGSASPAAAKILREKGIDPAQVQGTGKDGRITKEDAEKAQASAASKAAAPAASASAKTTPTPASVPAEASGSRNERRVKMTSLRKTISRRLVAVKNETAMLTTFNEVNMQPIMDLRAKYKDIFKE